MLPDVPDVDLATFALRHAVRLAERPALIDGDRVVTYAELAERTARALDRPRRRVDLPAEWRRVRDRAARRARAGAAVTPVSPLLTEREAAPLLAIERADEDVALLLSSSGTTGLPKVVQLTHRGRDDEHLPVRRSAVPYREGERVLGLAPFFHVMGLSLVLLHALSSGATVVTMQRFDLEEMLHTVEKHRVGQMRCCRRCSPRSPSTRWSTPIDLSSLRLVAGGGAPATAELEAAVAARLGCLVAQGYGMTEAGPMIASPVIEPLRIRHGSVGLPMPGTEVELVEGEVWVRGPHLMSGYLGNAEATAATIDADGWLHTGDTGRFDDDGFLYLGDRIKELIKVKGFQVAPAELEGVLRTHPAVADAAVVGVPDDEAGERPVAFVVARGELDRDELMAFVAVQVAPYKQLREVELVDALPRSPTGKLLRRMLVLQPS